MYYIRGSHIKECQILGNLHIKSLNIECELYRLITCLTNETQLLFLYLQ